MELHGTLAAADNNAICRCCASVSVTSCYSNVTKRTPPRALDLAPPPPQANRHPAIPDPELRIVSNLINSNEGDFDWGGGK